MNRGEIQPSIPSEQKASIQPGFKLRSDGTWIQHSKFFPGPLGTFVQNSLVQLKEVRLPFESFSQGLTEIALPHTQVAMGHQDAEHNRIEGLGRTGFLGNLLGGDRHGFYPLGKVEIPDSGFIKDQPTRLHLPCEFFQ